MSDMLNKLKAMQQQRQNASKGGVSKYLKLPQEGETVVRFLPAKGDPDAVFFKEFGEHWIELDSGKKTRVVCPKVTAQERCPICEAVNELYEAGDDESKETARQFKVKKQHYANVIVRGQEDEGPKIYKFGIRLADRIVDDCVDEGVNISDPTEGFDYRIIKQKVDGFPNYDRSKPTKNASSVADEVDGWLAAADDIHALINSEVKSYDEIKALFSGVETTDVTEEVATEEFDSKKFLKGAADAVA
jgi:hypothetical protein